MIRTEGGDEFSDEEIHAAVSHAIMEARVRWGWTFGKRAKVMAIDMLMADAAIAALKATPPQGDAT